jgi:isopentenyl diphosphate isomerase/L-lactate dehydrogenase-like FMN-dependent dehydrogenase
LPHPAQWLNADDVRDAARRRLPRGLYELIVRGAEAEVAVAHNRDALQRWKLRTRVLRDVSQRSTECVLFGRTLAMPVVIAPTGPAGLVWYQGETEMARAAQSSGVPFTLSTAASNPLERVRADGGGQQWFQLYVGPDRDASFALVDRARDAGYEALVLTVDAVVPYNRPFGRRNGFSMPIRLNPRNGLDVALHPRWLLGVIGRYVATTGFPSFPNYPGYATNGRMDKCERLNWQDVAALRQRWSGPLLLKGITTAADAEQAVRCGVDGVVVSNHAGMAFDSAMAPIDVLEEVVAAVAGRAQVLVDSGFTRGSDVVKALCLGADAVMVGRLPLLGLAGAGRAGAARALELLQAEISHTLAVMGCTDIDALDRASVSRM